MKTFEINNKTYTGKELTFNAMCFFEDNGVSFEEIDKKPMKFARAYLAFCGNMTPDAAGTEIEQHFIAGGGMDDLFAALEESIETSGFFRALAGLGEPENQTEQKKTTSSRRKA